MLGLFYLLSIYHESVPTRREEIITERIFPRLKIMKRTSSNIVQNSVDLGVAAI